MPAQETVEIHGYALREIRALKGRNTVELAGALGCDPSYISRIELGYARRVSRVFYRKLLAELGIKDERVLLGTAPVRSDDDERVA